MPDQDWRDLRRQERNARQHRWRGGGSWLAGVILIAVGIVFLAQNFGYPVPNNWWAVFILIPAFVSFGAAWSMYQRNGGRATSGVASAFVAGLLLLALAVAFFLNIDLGKFWPLILIALGVVALLGNGRWRQQRPPMS
jgi:peptidoglycan/LPS O-acetylase OafA/YrhL